MPREYDSGFLRAIRESIDGPGAAYRPQMLDEPWERLDPGARMNVADHLRMQLAGKDAERRHAWRSE